MHRSFPRGCSKILGCFEQFNGPGEGVVVPAVLELCSDATFQFSDAREPPGFQVFTLDKGDEMNHFSGIVSRLVAWDKSHLIIMDHSWEEGRQAFGQYLCEQRKVYVEQSYWPVAATLGWIFAWLGYYGDISGQ